MSEQRERHHIFQDRAYGMHPSISWAWSPCARCRRFLIAPYDFSFAVPQPPWKGICPLLCADTSFARLPTAREPKSPLHTQAPLWSPRATRHSTPCSPPTSDRLENDDHRLLLRSVSPCESFGGRRTTIELRHDHDSGVHAKPIGRNPTLDPSELGIGYRLATAGVWQQSLTTPGATVHGEEWRHRPRSAQGTQVGTIVQHCRSVQMYIQHGEGKARSSSFSTRPHTAPRQSLRTNKGRVSFIHSFLRVRIPGIHVCRMKRSSQNHSSF
jgi:hypothetical protein